MFPWSRASKDWYPPCPRNGRCRNSIWSGASLTVGAGELGLDRLELIQPVGVVVAPAHEEAAQVVGVLGVKAWW